MNQLDACRKRISNAFNSNFDAAFKEQFGVEIETGYNIVSMRLISIRKDSKKLTKEQALWCAGYSDGYAEAMKQVTKPTNEQP